LILRQAPGLTSLRSCAMLMGMLRRKGRADGRGLILKRGIRKG
jgi:hypothetical protein